MPIIQLQTNILMLYDTYPRWIRLRLGSRQRTFSASGVQMTLTRAYIYTTYTFKKRTSSDDLQFWHIYWIPHKTTRVAVKSPAPNIIIIIW